MSYTIVPQLDRASNFIRLFHKQYRFTLDDFCDLPLPEELLRRFNSISMPRKYVEYFEDIRNLKVYEDDIWVITYPKCGTTWTQEAVWQICNDVDVAGKGKLSLRERFPFLEILSVAAAPDKELPFEYVNQVPRPRFIKTHLPICFLPMQIWKVKPKIIYTSRDPKDTAISFYHHYYNLYTYQGTKEEFLECFLDGKVEHGNYWDHVEQFYLLQQYYPNLKFIKYEDMKHNLKETILELCKFLDKSLPEEKIETLLHHLQFESMKANTALNNEHLTNVAKLNRPGSEYAFIRRGITGAYEDEMPAEFIDKFNVKTKERFTDINIYL